MKRYLTLNNLVFAALLVCFAALLLSGLLSPDRVQDMSNVGLLKP